MESEGGNRSLHRRLVSTVLRAAEVQEDSRLALEQHAAIDERVIATLEESRVRRDERAQQREVRNRTRR